MSDLVAQSILRDRRIAYALTDRDLNVIEVSSSGDGLQSLIACWLGRRLIDVVPELVGSEEVLDDLLAGQAPRYQIPWVNRDEPESGPTYFTMIVVPRRDMQDRITGLIHIIQDVTETGLLEQRVTQQRNELRLLGEELRSKNTHLEAINAELRHLDEMKSAFVSIAAHELRTPLASITGYLEVLLDGDVGALLPQQADYLRIIESSAWRLLHITNQLLDTTRIEAGRIELLLQPADLVRLVESVAEEQAPRIDARQQRITLRAEVGLPRALCDVARAAQVLGNLLDNANKYSPHGATITISLTRSAEEGFIEVAVADEGIGISAEDCAGLFHPFWRAGAAALTGAPGAGLGLYIARSLVELHGGRIWLDSVVGRGSTFYVTFPSADSPRAAG
jgi:signal transduction histidine kinase